MRPAGASLVAEAQARLSRRGTRKRSSAPTQADVGPRGGLLVRRVVCGRQRQCVGGGAVLPVRGRTGVVVLCRAQLHDSERQNADPESGRKRCNHHRPVGGQPTAHRPKDVPGALPHDRDHNGDRD